MGAGAPPVTRPARPPRGLQHPQRLPQPLSAWGPPPGAAQPPQTQTLPLEFANSSLGHGAELGLCWDPTECWGCRGGSNPQTLPRWKGLCWGEVLLVPSSQPCSLEVPGAGGMSTSVASSGIKIGTPPPAHCLQRDPRASPAWHSPGLALLEVLGAKPHGGPAGRGPGMPAPGRVCAGFWWRGGTHTDRGVRDAGWCPADEGHRGGGARVLGTAGSRHGRGR